MRTTVTLDADVAEMLRQATHRNHSTFKKTLNLAVRKGLAGTLAEEAKPYKVVSRSMGLRVGLDPAGLNKLADDLEAEAFLELTRKLGRGKPKGT
jgi:hypothetical protein